MKYVRLLAIVLAWFLVIGCGDTIVSPTDPTPERIVFRGQVPLDGTLPQFQLPTNRTFPLITCYVSADQENWIPVNAWPAANGVPVCFLKPGPSIILAGTPPGWYYVITAQ